jgi:hypothetical protein
MMKPGEAMGITVLIPLEGAYTLYARGEMDAHSAVPGRGTYIKFTEGSAAVLFYKWKRHRRVYIVRESSVLKKYQAVKLPGLRRPVGILGKFRGRRVDITRRACFNLERINGFEVYRYGTRFWQRVCCLIDNYDGYRSAAVKSNLYELSRRHMLIGKDGEAE